MPVMTGLPHLALSVRQPSAWAILHGGKDVENRSLGSIRAGRMGPGRIAIHAATGMTRAEYEYLVWRWQRDGVRVPRPDALPRGAIIGSIEVACVVTESDSPWFGGEAGLLLRDPVACDPVPATGALGYFRWQAGGTLAAPSRWMRDWGGGPDAGLFGDALPVQHAAPPVRPFGKSALPARPFGKNAPRKS